MKESLWGVVIVMIGLIAIAFIYFFQSVTNTEEHNYALLKETTEAAMVDAFDLAAYRATYSTTDPVIRIDREKFVENFIRRFAESASLSRTYVIEIYDVNEYPPKVSLKVSSTDKGNVTGEEIMTFDISTRLDAILETPY